MKNQIISADSMNQNLISRQLTRPTGNIEMKAYYVYIMSNIRGTLYTGVTNQLKNRVYTHKKKLIPGFTSRYNIDRLVYYEEMGDVKAAIAREKQIKSWRREKKIRLIATMNPTWRDLSEDWFEDEDEDADDHK